MSTTIPIVATEGVLGGKPCIESTCTSINQVGTLVRERDWDPELVRSTFDLSVDEVEAALDYYDAYLEEIAAIRERRRERVVEARGDSRAPDSGSTPENGQLNAAVMRPERRSTLSGRLR